MKPSLAWFFRHKILDTPMAVNSIKQERRFYCFESPCTSQSFVELYISVISVYSPRDE